MSNPRNINQVLQGASASQPAQLPGIPAVQVDDRALADVLRAIKERLEVREGTRGNPFEAAVTWRQLDELGLVRTTPAPARVTDMAGIIAQTKNGEFVQVSVQDLAAAVTPTTTTITPTADASVLVNALKVQLTAQLAALGIRIDGIDTSGTSGAYVSLGDSAFHTRVFPLPAALKGKPEINPDVVFFDAYNNNPRVPNSTVNDVFTVQSFCDYIYNLVVGNVPIKLNGNTILFGTTTVNNAVSYIEGKVAAGATELGRLNNEIVATNTRLANVASGVEAITLHPDTIAMLQGTDIYGTPAAQNYTMRDVMNAILGINARLAAHGI